MDPEELTARIGLLKHDYAYGFVTLEKASIVLYCKEPVRNTNFKQYT